MWTLSGFADEISADVEEQCAHLRGLGVGHLELRSGWGRGVLDLSDAQLDQVQQLLDRHALRVSSIGSPIGKIGVTDPFAPHLARMRRALDVAQRLGAPYVRIFSFFLPAGDDPDDHRPEVLERMRRLADLAEAAEVTLLHENEKEIYGDVPRRCLDVVESVASPRLRLAWDPANFVQVGVRPFTEGYDLLRPHLEYVQIKDARLADGEVVPAGQGDGEVARTLRALRDDGFDGFFSLEPHLDTSHAFGGFSGPDRFTEAWRAFTGLLDADGIPYR